MLLPNPYGDLKMVYSERDSVQKDTSSSAVTSSPGQEFGLDTLVTAINEAVSNGEGILGPSCLLQEFDHRGWMLVDDRDPRDTDPNNEILIEKVICAYDAAITSGMGEFSKHRLAHELRRCDLVLININPCVQGKCASPRTCNDFSECDVEFSQGEARSLPAI